MILARVPRSCSPVSVQPCWMIVKRTDFHFHTRRSFNPSHTTVAHHLPVVLQQHQVQLGCVGGGYCARAGRTLPARHWPVLLCVTSCGWVLVGEQGLVGGRGPEGEQGLVGQRAEPHHAGCTVGLTGPQRRRSCRQSRTRLRWRRTPALPGWGGWSQARCVGNIGLLDSAGRNLSGPA